MLAVVNGIDVGDGDVDDGEEDEAADCCCCCCWDEDDALDDGLAMYIMINTCHQPLKIIKKSHLSNSCIMNHDYNINLIRPT